MTAISTLISAGGGGAQIGEYVNFTDRGSIFTDENGFVWLKGGVVTTDTTTYPDAIKESVMYSTPTDFLGTIAFSSNPYGALGCSSNGQWVMGPYTSQGTTYTQSNMVTGSVHAQNLAWPSVSSFNNLNSASYVTCTASSGIHSYIANTDNTFAVALGLTNTNNACIIQSAYLYGYNDGNQTGAPGRPLAGADKIELMDNTGTKINSSPFTHAYRGGMHWDGPNNRLIVCLSQAVIGNFCRLYIYDFSGDDWGKTTATYSPSTKNSTAAGIDYIAEATVDSVYGMSGSATHLYVHYGKVGVGRSMRKIPLSGNLSWSSGTDISNKIGTVYTESATGSVSSALSYYGIGFRELDGTTEKFVAKVGYYLKEFSFVPLIGEGSGQPTTGRFGYQRIK